MILWHNMEHCCCITVCVVVCVPCAAARLQLQLLLVSVYVFLFNPCRSKLVVFKQLFESSQLSRCSSEAQLRTDPPGFASTIKSISQINV